MGATDLVSGGNVTDTHVKTINYKIFQISGREVRGGFVLLYSMGLR